MKIRRLILNLDKYLGVIALLSLLAMTFVQILIREFFGMPIQGTGELGGYFLIFITFIAAPFVIRSCGQMKMGELSALFKGVFSKLVTSLNLVLSIITFGVIAVSAIKGTISNFNNVTSNGMPIYIYFLPTIIGFVCSTVAYVSLLIRYLSNKAESKL